MTTFNAITLSSLNLRATTSTSGTLVTTIPANTEITVSLISGNDTWLAASYGSYEGYVVAQYVSIPDAGATCFVSASSVNVRKTPSLSGTWLYTAAGEAVLQLLDSTSVTGWYRISSGQGVGWASSDYLTILTTTDKDETEGGEDGDDTTSDFDIDNTYFRLGDQGDDIFTYLHDPLLKNHYTYGSSDQTFTYATEWAVKYFQSRNELTVDGIAGPATLRKLHGLDGYIEPGVDKEVYEREAEGPAVADIKMNNKLWSGVEFDASDTKDTTETIGDSGNAPTAIAIAFSTLLKAAVLPPVICQEALDAGLRDSTGTTGVIDKFYWCITAGHDVVYLGEAENVEAIRTHCANGGIAVTRLTYNSDYPYCSTNGATHVVVYKVDDDYVYFENTNQAGNAPVPCNAWADPSWVKETWLYSLD